MTCKRFQGSNLAEHSPTYGKGISSFQKSVIVRPVPESKLSFFGTASLRVAWSNTTIPDTTQMLKHFLVIMQSEPDVLEETKKHIA